MTTDRLKLDPSSRPLRGPTEVPGDKSISHRALIIGALGDGTSHLRNLNTGDDVGATARTLGQLGAGCDFDSGRVAAVVAGTGWTGLREPGDVLDAGNSGTTLRMMLGVCAGVDGMSLLTGDDSLRRRPMLRVVAPLREMGARIDGRKRGDRPPLAVRGGSLQGVDVNLSVASAQVKSAVLLAGLGATGQTSVAEPQQSRDHTERMLAAAGADVVVYETATMIKPSPALSPIDMRIPGDLSAAMFLAVAAAVVPGSELVIEGVGLNPTRSGAVDVLRRMGVDIETTETSVECGEPVGRLQVRASEPVATQIGGEEIPRLIDELPVLMVLAARARGETVIHDAAELRVKESDRIASMVAGLRGLGVDADEFPDGAIVRGPVTLTGGEVESGGDHRVAMSFAIAGLMARDPVVVNGWRSVETSFPQFTTVLDRARGLE